MNTTSDATSIFGPLWRRKWLILAVGVIVAAASYFYYRRERPVYQVSTQVYLGAGAEEQAPGEKSSVKSQAGAVSNQVAIIDSIVAEKVHKQLRREHKGAVAKDKVKAKVGGGEKSSEKSQFITVTAEGHTAKGVALLANATVHAYITRQSAVRQRVIEQAIAITRRQLRRIEAASLPKVAKSSTSKGKTAKGKAPTPEATSTANVLQIANLNSKINQLESALAVTGSQQIKPAKAATAVKLSPMPRKNAEFGFVVGIVLASIAAYSLGRLDRRLRSFTGVEAVFGMQVLAGFPSVRRPIVRRDGQPAPSRFLIEPLRRLHTALQMGVTPGPDGRSSARVIVFTSADAGDGKSTLVADLALVQRDAGARVAVLEANLRRPVQAKLLGLGDERGLADVLAGRLTPDEALQRVLPIVPPARADAPAAEGAVTAVEAPAAGSLFLLAGGAVPNPPALLENGAMANVLESIADEFDYVLIDAPSPLEVSDVMPLLNTVDGIVIVARLGHTREPSAQRLVQLLADPARAPVVGVLANCVPRAEARRYGYWPNGRLGPGRLIGR
jgi:Mrp family chromosome partitioning ATPase